jgi:hypothetical protein
MFLISYPRNQIVMDQKVGIFWDFWGVWEYQGGPKKQIPLFIDPKAMFNFNPF